MSDLCVNRFYSQSWKFSLAIMKYDNFITAFMILMTV